MFLENDPRSVGFASLTLTLLLSQLLNVRASVEDRALCPFDLFGSTRPTFVKGPRDTRRGSEK